MRQFWMHLAARWRLLDDAPARAALQAPAMVLFASMSKGDQRHGLCVLATLRHEGDCPPALAAAALLHDVGKAEANLHLAARTLIVLVRAVRPGWLAALARQPWAPWRHQLQAQLGHAERGAELCARAGCAPDTVVLVRHHEGPPPTGMDTEQRRWLTRLQQADDRC